MARPRLTVAQLIASGKARHMSKADLDERRLQEQLATAQAKKISKRPARTATPAATGKPSNLRAITAAPAMIAEESSLESFLLQTRQERKSFAARMVPGETIARNADGSVFAWPDKHPLSIMKVYADSVVQNGIVAGQLCIRACARFLKDIETGAERGIFLDPLAVEDICEWYTTFGAEKYELLPWQVFVVGNVFGWKLPSGLRRFRECWLEIAKKNSKTYLMAGCALFLLVADNEPHAEVYCAANSRDQAKILYKSAVRIWNANDALHDGVTKFQNSFTYDTNTLTIVSSETRASDGPNVSGLFLDEVHEFANDELTVKYTAGIVARKQPLVFYSTTAGDTLESFGGQKHEYFARLLTGIFENDSQFAFIAAMDKEDDYKDEAMWPKSNVSLGHTVQIENLRAQILEIEQDQSLLTKFLRYHANQWIATNASHTFPISKIELCGGPMPELNAHELRDFFLGTYCADKCFSGIDIGLVDDLSCACAVWPAVRWPNQELGTPSQLVAVPWFFMPEEKIADREKQWRVPLRTWIKAGWITPLAGDILDFALLKDHLKKLFQSIRSLDCGFDCWQASVITAELQDEKVAKFTKVPQQEGFLTLPCKELKHAVLSGRFCYLRNPVMKWMLQNAILDEGKRGGIVPQKLTRNEKIDGVSACVNAIQRMCDPENKAALLGYEQYFFI